MILFGCKYCSTKICSDSLNCCISTVVTTDTVWKGSEVSMKQKTKSNLETGTFKKYKSRNPLMSGQQPTPQSARLGNSEWALGRNRKETTQVLGGEVRVPLCQHH